MAIKEKARALAVQAGRPFLFVPSSQTSKEELVRRIAAQDQVTEGLIAVLTAVEPCQSFRVVGNRQTKMIELKVETRKCSHLYFYYEHPRFGFMHWDSNTIGARRRASMPPMLFSKTRQVWRGFILVLSITP